ncbi:uncharacterized protein LOC114359398 [Ostrinia furnacalis]|uniref:uncharacterized protein LOC114359398 n=1 Tax=Ostrinia furnacalis TaxID=93504 RepID=UPI00103927BE|nr:uncharacterized protein LOC114359398 [Ostrinia furnacalis]
MSKERAKKEEKAKQPRPSEAKTNTNSKASISDESTKRKTRMSNIKEEGFYNYRNMVIRNVKSQAESTEGKVSKRGKKRVKKPRK